MANIRLSVLSESLIPIPCEFLLALLGYGLSQKSLKPNKFLMNIDNEDLSNESKFLIQNFSFLEKAFHEKIIILLPRFISGKICQRNFLKTYNFFLIF